MHLHKVLDIAVQVASALSAAHQASIIHRDIKPENIMVRTDGYVKVLDFGLAKLTERDATALLDAEASTVAKVKTEPGMVMGTINYMSPEQARGREVDARTDIWSLGVVLYEMITGRLPFEGSSVGEMFASILSEREPAPLARFTRDAAPAELERIIAKALRKDRDERYQTMKDLLLDLKSLKQELEFEIRLGRSAPELKSQSASPTSGQEAVVETIPEPTARPTSAPLTERIARNKTGVIIIASLVLLVAATAAVYFYHSRKATIDSIAVLPFVNATADPNMEYLSDGLTESLIDSLSQLPKLNVKARSSVFRYKGKEIEPQTIASELSVQAILNGRVVQRGDNLTLYLSLVDGRSGNQIWGTQYNRKQTDLVTLESEVARDVASKLQARLSGADEQRLAKNYTENTEAYQLYLQGLYHWNKLSPPEIRKSMEYFQQAVEVDPNYAQAYAVMGRAFFSLALTGDAPAQEVFAKAREATTKALKIDDTLSEAHTTFGWIKFFNDWDWSGSEKEFQRALGLNPNLAETSIAYAHLLAFTGRYAEAMPMAERARELDPLNLRINALEGQFLFYAERYDDSLIRLQKTIELEPSFWLAHLFIARVYIEKKMYGEAITEATKARDLSNGNSEAIALIIYALAKSGKRDEAEAVLDELKKRAAERYVPPYCLALSYNGLDETDQAMASLEKGFEQRDVRMVFLKVEPKWSNLRSDARFSDLLRRVGFAP